MTPSRLFAVTTARYASVVQTNPGGTGKPLPASLTRFTALPPPRPKLMVPAALPAPNSTM